MEFNIYEITKEQIEGMHIDYKSKKYYIGSEFISNNCGKFHIIGKSINKKNYYFIKFSETKYITIAKTDNILLGKVKDPLCPSVKNTGFIGIGKNKSRINGKINKEYALWERMITRCYCENFHKLNPTYKDCEVHKRWHNFQNFCEDIKKIEGYAEWINDNHNIYCFDKDKRSNGKKIYSIDMCVFITKYENTELSNHEKQKSFVATRISDGYTEEAVNQRKFGRKYSLQSIAISKCLRGQQKTTKGWKFKLKEEC